MQNEEPLLGPCPTEADIEDILIDILKDNRPGKEVRGCNSHLAIYDLEVQKRILEPLLKARGSAGLVQPVDDLGHDTHFKYVWNRAIRGEAEAWDCRTLAAIFVRACLKEVPDLLNKVFNDQFDEIDAALVTHLPAILAGSGFMRPATLQGLKSWVDGDHVWMRFDGMMPQFCEKDGSALREPETLPAFMFVDSGGASSFTAMMSFHGDGIEHDEGQKAWMAWRNASDARKVSFRGQHESMMGMALVNLLSANQMGINQLTLRQDEHVSIDAGPDGFTLYRGTVSGLPSLCDEGQLLVGKTSAFVSILMEGGFSEEEARDYLARLSRTSSAVQVDAPEGYVAKCLLDPELLIGADFQAPYEMASSDSIEAAVPIFAAGTFPMPEMKSLREIRSEKSGMSVDLPTP